MRSGLDVNGFSDLEVAAAGEYLIELRRWPRELDWPMNQIIDARELDPRFADPQDQFEKMPSRKFDFVSAKLKMGDAERTCEIQPSDRSVTFTVELSEGPVNLQTWLAESNGNSVGAYYVYVENRVEQNAD